MIRMNSFASEPEELLSAEARAAERVVRSGWYILGEELKRFEKSFAAWAGMPHAAGVGNGMDAIEIGLRAAAIGKGDEVITTAVTAYATILAVLRAGATPVLADIESGSGLLDTQSVERCITPRTKAVLLVHLYGQVPDLDSWTRFCAERRIALVEDCAQAYGARWGGRAAGSFGLFGAFSFYPTKNLGALGDGGAVAASTADLDARVRVIRNYGQTERYHHGELGLNSRLDEMQAAILSERLQWLDRFTVRRRQVAQAYRAGISNPRVAQLSTPCMEENHVYHLFVVTCRDRDGLSRFLKDQGIESLIHYPIPAHKQAPTIEIKRDPNGLAGAEAFASACLSIPCHPQLSDSEVEKVIGAINDFR
jgi:dTDP-4-amino-4,6-dideoxygalactose transaminase